MERNVKGNLCSFVVSWPQRKGLVELFSLLPLPTSTPSSLVEQTGANVYTVTDVVPSVRAFSPSSLIHPFHCLPRKQQYSVPVPRL